MAARSHEIPELDRQGLRRFAFSTGGIIAVLFGLALPWLLGFAFPVWPWIVAAVLLAWGAAAPDSLRPVYHYWMRFGLLLSCVTTPLVLGAIFFLVFVPIACVMRLAGRDAMARKLDRHASSYRVDSRAAPRENMEKPF